MYPSLCFASWSVTSDRTAGKNPPGGPEAMGPSPFPASPWHTRQYVSYRNFPRLSDSDVRVRGFVSRSALLRSAAGGAPVTGTVPGTGARLRLYGLKLRWWRMVANQPTWCTTSSGLQAATAKAARAARAARDLRTPHLLGAGLAQQRLHLARPVGGAGDEDAELVVREAGIVQHRAEAARREHRVEGDAEDRREGAEQHGHLEHDDDVRRDRADRLAAHDDRPIIGHVQREPGADGAAGCAADQREHPHRAHGLVEDVFELVSRDRGVDGEVVVAAGAQPPQGVDRGVELAEHAEHPGGGRRVEDRAQRGERGGQLHACTARAARWGGGKTSLTSEIDTAGKFFTNRRNHMKNHPKLPAMMPQSAHVAL